MPGSTRSATRVASPGDEFKDFVVKDMEKWKGVATSANIVLED